MFSASLSHFFSFASCLDLPPSLPTSPSFLSHPFLLLSLSLFLSSSHLPLHSSTPPSFSSAPYFPSSSFLLPLSLLLHPSLPVLQVVIPRTNTASVPGGQSRHTEPSTKERHREESKEKRRLEEVGRGEGWEMKWQEQQNTETKEFWCNEEKLMRLTFL